jgi:hypothetical protein
MRRVGIRLGLGLGVLVVMALVLTPSAYAHVPIVGQPRDSEPLPLGAAPYSDAQRIEQPVKSLAIYGFLAHDESHDAYRFSVPREATVELELLVPVRAALRDFAPTLQVVEARTYDGQRVPSATRDTFFEPFSLTSFWRVAKGSVSLKPGHEYFFVVQAGEGQAQSGSYVIAVGGPETFTGSDWARTARALPVIWSGAWGGGPFRPGALWCFGFGLLAAVVGIVALVRRQRRRRGTE